MNPRYCTLFLSLAVLLAGLVAFVCPAFADLRLQGAKTASVTSSSDGSNATVTILATSAGNEHHIYAYDFQVSSADTVTIKCGSTIKGNWDLVANQGITRMLYPLGIECAPGEAFTATKGIAATPLRWSVYYKTELAD